eukprot:1473262-Rhodomonas_salina.2
METIVLPKIRQCFPPCYHRRRCLANLSAGSKSSMLDLSLPYAHSANPHSHSTAEPVQCETSARHDLFEDEDGPFGLVPEDYIGQLFEIIPGRLSLTIHGSEDHTKECIKRHPHLFFFSSWMQEAYNSFFSDFGPVNIAVVARFCDFMKEKMQDPRIAQRHL